MSEVSAIAFEYSLPCSPERAFDVYVARIGEWWHQDYTANAETLQDVIIEPRVGGRVYATHSDLGEHDWGEVVVFEPGRRLVHTFTLAQDPTHPTEVAVEFVDAGGRCTLRFAHGGWTEANAADRRKFGDWPVMLDRLSALAAAG